MSDRRYLAFDADAAGQEASLEGWRWRAAKGLAGAGCDASRRSGIRPTWRPTIRPRWSRRWPRRRGVPDLSHPARAGYAAGSRDERYESARALLSAAPPSVERDDLVSVVADRLELSDDLTARLTSRPPRSNGGDPRRPEGAPLPRERDERLFLGLCLAFPESGLDLLCSLDVAHFPEPSRWEAATVVRRRLSGDLASEEEPRWAPMIAELTALASQEATSQAVLQELYWKLRLRRRRTS